jgi:hypothetical protein
VADRISVEIDGLGECLRAFNGLEKDLRKNANSELRNASKQIARGIPPMLGGSGAPQEAAVIAAAGPKSDRYVVVAVPARKPALSGARKTRAALAKRIGWAIEGGSLYPPFHHPKAGAMIERHIPRIEAYAVPRYKQALAGILRKHGLL